MERSKKPQWKKIKRGTLILRNPKMRIKFEQVVRLALEEIPPGFRDQFELVEKGDGNYEVDQSTVKEKEVAQKEEAKESLEEYSLFHIGAGWYNVISPEGVEMNDKKLRADDAKELKESLEQQQPPE